MLITDARRRNHPRHESRTLRLLLPPALLVGLSVAVGLVLVDMTVAVVAPLSSLRMRITLCVIAAIVSAGAATLGLQWLVVMPLRRALRLIYQLTDGDFSARARARGFGMTADIMHALDDLAGRLEARYEAVRAAERRYRLLYENSPAGLFRTRLDGRVVECNMAAARMLGYDSLIDAKTRNAGTYYADPGDRERVIARLRAEGAITNALVNLRRKDGRALPVLLTVHRLVVADGAYFEGQFIDATGLGLEEPARRERDAAGPMRLTAVAAGSGGGRRGATAAVRA